MKTKENTGNASSKSDEVQTIIDRMPTYWTKWIALFVFLFIGIVILLGFIIKYPDTVDGQISITASIAPIRLVANSSGRICLLRPNKYILKKGEVISYIESGANYKHILIVDSLLQCLKSLSSANALFPDSLILGDVSSAYNSYQIISMQYRRLQNSDIYETMRLNLTNQTIADRHIVENIEEEIRLKRIVLSTSKEHLYKDSVLMIAKGLSLQEFQKQRNAHLLMEETLLSLKSSKLMKQSEIGRNQLEIERITLEEIENKEKNQAELITRKNELANAINLWKERYLQYSPIFGELEYLGFWRDNSFVTSGIELFTVIPEKKDIIGEVMIPSYGAGKVKIGQQANVKIDNYPYDEYGQMKGVVKSVARITNKIQTKDGDRDAYSVIVSFPNGTITNFKKELLLDFESRGTVEIITKHKRLIERLFDDLKAKAEK